jgi:hypothetical protein
LQSDIINLNSSSLHKIDEMGAEEDLQGKSIEFQNNKSITQQLLNKSKEEGKL